MNRIRAWLMLIFAPLWRWKWLLLVLLLITGGYATFAVSDVFVHKLMPATLTSVIVVGPTTPYTEITHGWPLEYETRYVPLPGPPAAWAKGGSLDSFHHWRLVTNLALAIGVSLLLTYLAAWRFTTGQCWQFRLVDLLALTVVIAAVLGWGRRWETNYQVDRAYLDSLAIQGCHATWVGKSIWYLRPLRDLGVVSRESLFPLELDLGAPYDPNSFEAKPFGPEYWEERLLQETSDGRRLRHPVSAITVFGGLRSDEGMDALVRWAPRCERFEFHRKNEFTDRSIQQIVASWPMLTELTLHGPNLTSQSIQSLSSLQRLEKLRIDSYSRELTIADLRPLLESPALREVYVPFFLERQLTKEEKERFADRGIDIIGPISRRFQFPAKKGRLP